ncbi:MAG TPA: metal-dependent hydrolase [Terriglobia bacterium]|jgi:inner membrane protein|nr:metal-dependent hydrolase [Terriglobia bacterium]
MDNITHTLTGLAISQAGFNRKTRFATLAIVIGANLPDIDAVSSFWGSVAYLKYHRGITHSIIGVTALALLLAGAIYLFGRRAGPPRKGPPLNGLWLLLACWVATASHLLLDFSNAYGIRPFLPFSGRWYAWGIEPIVDSLLWLLLLAGLALPALFRLISEEVGARKTGFQKGAIFSLCAMIALWGLRDVSHRRALNMLDALRYRQENPLRLGAFPGFGSPFSWSGVVETSQAFYVLPVNVLDSTLDTQDARIFHKPDPSPALNAALATQTARVFMSFARFPWSEVIPSDAGPTVLIRDLRFQPADLRRGGFAVRIQLDQDLHVRSQAFSFTGKFGGNQP